MPAGDGIPLLGGPLKPVAGGFGVRGAGKALLEELTVAALGLGKPGFRRTLHPVKGPIGVGLHAAPPEVAVGQMTLGPGLSGFGVGTEPLYLVPIIEPGHAERILRLPIPGFPYLLTPWPRRLSTESTLLARDPVTPFW